MTKSSDGKLFAYCLLLVFLAPAGGRLAEARTRTSTPKPQTVPNSSPNKNGPQNDSFAATPAKDLTLRADGERKAQALAEFVRGTALEENGEIDKALEAYRRVLNVDPGQAELACRVATLLSRENDYPQAIDILKDAIKANSHAPDPYLQLAYIYATYLNKIDQAVDYANRAVALDPTNIEAYQRLCQILANSGNEKKALETLDRAAKIKSDDPAFWTRLGKLYAALILKPDTQPKLEELVRTNEIFKRAVEHANDDPAVLKEIADYYAASQQVKEAIPLYLRILQLQPDDASAQQKLATGFVLTNQRTKAVDLLREIIKQHPDQYQPYELLAQVLDDQARALTRENKTSEAKAVFAKAAENYDQSLLINPTHATTYLRLAELLIGPLKDAERAITVLSEAHHRFPNSPEMIYYLALAQREAKHPQQAVALFEEALHETEMEASEVANARFYFDYGVTAEQAGLYDKAADLFQKSITLDPTNAADAYNYLGYMWADRNMRLEEAAAMIAHALELEPNNGAFLDSLGWVKFHQGKYEDALADLLRATQNLAHDDAVVFDHLGDTYLQLNRIPQALEAWQRALTLDPQNKNVAGKIDNAKTKVSKGNSPNPNSFQ